MVRTSLLSALAALLLAGAADLCGGAVDVAEPAATLRFDEILVFPIGPKGWELSEKTRRLDGQRVELTGYMVRELNPDHDIFLFASSPLTTYACESLAASDVPPNAIQVTLAPRPGLGIVWRPLRLTVVGRLELGHREERDGRVSHLRLVAEQIVAADSGEVVDLHLPLARRALGVAGGP